MPDMPLDRWVQRTTLVALVALAVALVATGVRLYGRPGLTETTSGRTAGLTERHITQDRAQETP